MKYIKSYENENINNEPKIEDWCIVKNAFNLDNIDEYINNSIGYIWGKSYSEKDFYVKYFNIPPQLKRYFNWAEKFNNLNDGNSILASKSEIIHWSKNKEDLEAIIEQNKYNL